MEEIGLYVTFESWSFVWLSSWANASGFLQGRIVVLSWDSMVERNFRFGPKSTASTVTDKCRNPPFCDIRKLEHRMSRQCDELSTWLIRGLQRMVTCSSGSRSNDIRSKWNWRQSKVNIVDFVGLVVLRCLEHPWQKPADRAEQSPFSSTHGYPLIHEFAGDGHLWSLTIFVGSPVNVQWSRMHKARVFNW